MRTEENKIRHRLVRKYHPLQVYGWLRVTGIALGLFTLVGCASTGTPVATSGDATGWDNQSSRPFPDQDINVSLSTDYQLSDLYHQMVREGHYSDAAIFQSLQDFKPQATSLTSIGQSVDHLSAKIPLPDLSYAGTSTNSTLESGWHAKVGWTFILDGNYPAAEAAYRQALRHEPGSAEAYLGLGMALMFQGKREQAILAYEEALKIHPSYAAALVHLGYAYADSLEQPTENRIKARTLFQQASDLGDPFALLALMGLQETKEGI